MKRVLCVLLSLFVLPAFALADADLKAMSTEDLVQLRFSIDQVIASRAGTDDAQVLDMDGVLVTMDYAALGTVKDVVNGEFVQKKAIVVFVRVSNSTDNSILVRSSFHVQASLDGIILSPLMTASESVSFQDGSVFNPYLSASATVRPFAVNMQIGFGFYLPDNAAGTVSIDFIRQWISNGYGGSLDIDLSGLSI